MQYLLTKEEFNNLVPKADLMEIKDEIKNSQKLIREAFKCARDRRGYCDDCALAQLRNICLGPRDFSK